MNIHTLIYNALLHLGIKRDRTIIPLIAQDELVPAINVEPLEKEQKDGNISAGELAVMCQLVKDRKPKTILEIGTFDGRTAVNLAHFSPDDAHVYTLDLPKNEMSKAKFGIEEGDSKYVDKDAVGERLARNARESGKITQLYGDSAAFDFTPYFGKIDFVFVDGSHSVPYARNDSEIALRLVRPGGIILWHDYGVWKGVTKVLNAYYSNDPRFRDIKHIKGTSLAFMEA
jgi:predicted O-methyltransferase YrrM